MIKLILLLIFLAKTNSELNETTTNKNIEIEEICKSICSNSKWEFSFEKKTLTCLCWVDNSIDDIEANAMQKDATNKGITLWVIRNKERLIRDINNSSTTTIKPLTEDLKSELIATKLNVDLNPTQSPDKTEIKSRVAENEEETQKPSKSTFLKKYKPNEKLFNKPKLDPIVGDAPKTIAQRLNPNRQKLPSNIKSCNSETVKLSLQNLKSHLNRLIDHPISNCGLLVNELETIKGSVQQLIVRVGEKKEQLLTRPKLIDQIREKEKERHAKIQSRLGHLDLPKKKLNLLGIVHKDDQDKEKKNGGVITQPIEFIDRKR